MDLPELPPREKGVNPLTGQKFNISNLRPSRTGRKPGAKNKVKDAFDTRGKDPILELITISELLRTSPPEPQRKALELEMKIWMELLEYKKAKKKPAKEDKASPAGSKASADATFNLLEELEKDANAGTTTESNPSGMVNGPINVEAEASPEEDL